MHISGITKLRVGLIRLYDAPAKWLLIANLVIALLVSLSNGMGVMLGHGMPGLTNEMEAMIVMFILPGSAAIFFTGLLGLIFSSARVWVLRIHAIVIGIGTVSLCYWALELAINGLPDGGFSWSPGFLESIAGYAALLVCRFNLPDRLRANGKIYLIPVSAALFMIPIDLGVLLRFFEKMQGMMHFPLGG